MNLDEEKIKESIQYFNQNKKVFLTDYTKNIELSTEKIALFTAGMSGVGKTELAIFLKESNPNLLHIDTDEIREFFRAIGYDGKNASLYQKGASRGFSELFTYALKNQFSLIMDSNFANIEIAIKNIERLLKKSYRIEILYLYDYPEKCFEYATRRELVTHRKVPKDVFLRSDVNSYKTVLEIKERFKERVNLHFFDKRENKNYQNIEFDFLKNSIGEMYDNYNE
ncbi:MAG: zeta toxin family protein [Sulfurovum sp.]|nr:zeta toxin family protein [Sulfurovum sp.]